ncbi:type I restriction enzyme endonuclease domain-containing protein [Empedobacter tilapiae]|uniref:type I restriction enzyme endonuclease domain-containing protein n=1 Tax=Empedobacter tilapiae TaxID=2491114 RepID=UPI003743D4F3
MLWKSIKQLQEVIHRGFEFNENNILSSFIDWFNNSNVRADLNQKIFFCLVKDGCPPQYNEEVFDQVMDQVENFKDKE